MVALKVNWWHYCDKVLGLYRIGLWKYEHMQTTRGVLGMTSCVLARYGVSHSLG